MADYETTQRSGEERTAIPQPWPAPGGAGGVSAAGGTPRSLLCHSIPPRGTPVGPETKATLSQPRSAKQLLQAAAAVCC